MVTVLRDVMLCILIDVHALELEVEAVHYFSVLVDFRWTTWHYISEDRMFAVVMDDIVQLFCLKGIPSAQSVATLKF